MSIEHIDRRRFADAEAEGALIRCEEEVDEAFVAAVCREGTPGPRDLKVIYSPLHGVGATAVCPVLAKAGFADVEVFAAHATPDGDFPNVPDNVSNPENPAVFDTIIERAREVGADVAMATDPDCDRLGCAAPLTPSDDAPWRTFTGNQLGALLTDYVLESRAARGDLTAEHYIAITLVTTPFCRRIAESYGVKTVGDLLVGFKWIGGVIDEYGPDKFVFGAEESHGYLVGQYARDKDGAVAALLLSELAAKVKAEGQSLHEKLAALSWQHGAHAEKTVSIQMPGSEGMQRMQALMSRMRDDPPEVIAKMRVERVRDYLQQTARRPGASPTPLAGPQGDMVVIDLEREGNYVAIRPSGTEPKVKFYMFSFEAPELLADLDTTQTELAQRLEAMEAELREIANNE